MKIILLGGKYSSGTTAAAAGLDDFKPAPLEALIGRAVASGTVPAAADLFSLFCSSAASAAFFLSIEIGLA